ncbi:MAG: SDR family NAD(P)-dependent oxidoreductase [Roseovarius sp.]
MGERRFGSDQGGEDIAIVGMSLKVPGAQNVDEYWRNLAAGVESIERLSKEALVEAGERPELLADPNYVPAAARLDGFDMFDPEVFGFGPKEAAILDPQHRKFLEVAWEALEQSGHAPGTGLDNVGVFAGCGMGSYFYFNICSNPELVDDVGMFLLRHTGNDKDFMATRVSHIFDLKGPSLGIQTACSTSLVTVHYACEALRAGTCDMALAGGSTIELPHGRGYLFKENEILSPDGHCHAFDHRAQGTVFGSGAGAVALRRLSDAIADGDPIWAVIKGSAVNNDGAAKAGYLAPSVDGQAAAVAGALKAAGVGAETIGYVECHGTGTYLGDPIEVAALTEAYRQSTEKTGFCRIGSVKSNIGHLDTAAGVASLIKASLALHHKQIPPSLGYEKPNPAIEFETSPFRVNDRLCDWPEAATPRRAGVNSLGVGGTNAHVIIEEAPARATSEEADWPFHVLCLSAHGKAALEGNAKALAAHLRAHPDVPLADVAWTLKEGRHGFDERRVVVAETPEEAAELLENGAPTRVFNHRKLGGAPDVAFMFPGGGAIYAGVARDLYETEPVFAEWMDRGLAHLEQKLDYDIRAIWLPEAESMAEAEARLKRPSVQLPLIMIAEYALAKLWMSWGITPAAMIGHSMGENTAAALAGVMSFEACIDLVLLRGRLFDTVPPGGMLSVPLPHAEIAPLLGDDLDIASINAPGLCAVSGPQASLDRLQAALEAREIECQRINIDIAAHSHMLDPILPEFRAFLASLELKAPEIPFISNRTGDWITPEQATSPDYWVDQLRNCVRFADGVARLGETADRVFIEVGPGRALSSLAQLSERIEPNRVLSSLRHEKDEIADDKYLLSVIGRFWALGVEADWSQIWGEARRNRVVLPTYAFQSRRFFIEPGKVRAADSEALPPRAEDVGAWGYLPAWRPTYANCPADRLETVGRDTPETWLLFADESGVVEALGQRLAEAGHRVTTVRAGDSFARLSESAYRLAPELGQEDYTALFETLAAEGRLPSRIVHGWLVTEAETFRPGSDFFTRNMEQGFYSLLYLANAIEAVERPGPLHITVLTNGAEQLKGEALPYPEKAAIAGPCGTIPKELPGVTVTSADIELPKRSDPAPRFGLFTPAQPAQEEGRGALIDQLLEELLAEPANAIAAYRSGRRHEKTWAQAPLPAAERPAFKQGGTYLVTGGLGGIGLSVARDLAETCAANIVLIVRRALPPREAWEQVAEGSGETARRIAALLELERLGGTVRLELADVCDIEQMRGAVARVRAEFGRIDGVIHAAGVIDDAPLLGKSTADVERVFDPKIHGLRVLDALFEDGALDLMLLFSSTSTATRPDGQIDYIAANEYLNAYAKSRAGGQTRVLALNWGVWASVGMAARAVAAPAEAEQPDWQPAEGPLLEDAAQGPEGDWLARLALTDKGHWVTNEHRIADGTAILPGTGYLELAMEAYRASGGALPVALQDLVFLRPVAATQSGPVELRTRLERTSKALRLEMRSAAERQGRPGMVLNAEARIAPLPGQPVPAPIDLAAIAARCPQRSIGMGAESFTSPQEAHLAFGPRWRVVTEAHIGTREGVARLSLPEPFASDLAEGYLLHPALMDLATGWAIELVEHYTAESLWVPVAYESVTVHAPLPQHIASWVRLGAETDADAGIATFDVLLTDPEGCVLVEVEGFQMQRLAQGASLSLPPLRETDDMEFADSPAHQAPANPQMSRMVALGIQPEEGIEAMHRALETQAPQVAISPLDLGRLIELAEPREAAAGKAQSFERPELQEDYAAPATPTEASLVEIWEGLLGVDRIGIRDSFFDLGGHSLLAVRLFAAIKRKHGVNFPISVLLEAPTVEALGKLVEAQGGGVAEASGDASAQKPQSGAARRYAVRLNAVAPGAEPPLFIVAGMFGNILNLRQLALQVNDRPVYGLQARGLIGSDAPHETIEAAATDYLEEVRAIQPEGPYLLAGFSGGGITAYEMAQQLKAADQHVEKLVLLDTPLPVRPALTRPDKALMKLQDLRRKGPRFLLEWAAKRWEWERRKRREAQGGTGGEAPGGFNNRRIEMAFRTAVARYELQPCDCPVVLFRPPLDRHWKVTGGNWVSTEREYVFDDNAWSPWIGQLEVIEVPGDHDSMVLMPNVRVLAKHLNGLIAAQGAARPRGRDAGVDVAAE